MPEGGSEHYKNGGIEPIELIEAQAIGFHLGNIIKYAVRANYYSNIPYKDVQKVEEAMDKIIWYAKRYKELVGPDK